MKGYPNKADAAKAEEVAGLLRIAALLQSESEYFHRKARAVMRGKPMGGPPRKVVETENADA
jgi:hypothetical protein